jgi:hypothetical protein
MSMSRDIDWALQSPGPVLRVLFFVALSLQVSNIDYGTYISAMAYGVASLMELPKSERNKSAPVLQIWNLTAILAASWMTRSISLNGTLHFVLWPLMLDLLLRMILVTREMASVAVPRKRSTETISLASIFNPAAVSSSAAEWLLVSVRDSLNKNQRIWSQRVSVRLSEILSRSGYCLLQLAIDSIDAVHNDGDKVSVRFEGSGRMEICIDSDLRLTGKFIVSEDNSVVFDFLLNSTSVLLRSSSASLPLEH